MIIDVSNSLSVGFYNAIITSGGGTQSFASAYMDKLNVETFYNTGGSGESAVDLAKYPIVAIMGAIFFLITSFVFLAAIGLLVSRYVVLIFLMILSAPAFAAMALPNDKYSGKWWDALWSQVLFAPIYFILSWVTLQILGDILASLGGDGAIAKAVTGSIDAAGNRTADPGAMAIFANFGIVIAFMIAALVIAKNLAGTAGKGISNFVGGVVGGATVGVGARILRTTLGAAGQRTLEDEGLKRKAARGDIGARMQLAAASSLSKASFDVRNTNAGKQFDLGKGGGKGGYAEIEKKQLKREEEYAKSLAPSDTTIDQAQQKAEVAKIEIPKLKNQLEKIELLRESSDREFSNQGGEYEVTRLKKMLGGFETAQSRVDELKGVSEKDAKARGIQPIESLAKVRQKQYAEKVEKSPFLVSWLTHGDRKARAATIRKIAGGKDAKQKAKEALQDLQKEGEIESDETPKEKPETSTSGGLEKTK